MKNALVIFTLSVLFLALTQAADTGKDVIGKLQVDLFFATNSDNTSALKYKPAPAAVVKKFSSSKELKYTKYFHMGKDTQNILRSYENWASPLRPSETILMSFQPANKPQSKNLKLDLELWQSKKKIMKGSPNLSVGKSLVIAGPNWRGGRLIIQVKLLSLK